MTVARIIEEQRKTTQSGKAQDGRWTLEFERQQPQRARPADRLERIGRHQDPGPAAVRHQGRGAGLCRRARASPSIWFPRHRSASSSRPTPTISARAQPVPRSLMKSRIIGSAVAVVAGQHMVRAGDVEMGQQPLAVPIMERKGGRRRPGSAGGRRGAWDRYPPGRAPPMARSRRRPPAACRRSWSRSAGGHGRRSSRPPAWPAGRPPPAAGPRPRSCSALIQSMPVSTGGWCRTMIVGDVLALPERASSARPRASRRSCRRGGPSRACRARSSAARHGPSHTGRNHSRRSALRQHRIEIRSRPS